MVDMEVENMENQKGGENVENKEAWWPLELEVRLDSKAETELAKNGVDYREDERVSKNQYGDYIVHYEIPMTSEEIKRYDVLSIRDGAVIVGEYGYITRIRYETRGADVVFEDEEEINIHIARNHYFDVPEKYKRLHEALSSDDSFGKHTLSVAILGEITRKGRLLSTEEAKQVVIEVLEELRDFLEHYDEIITEVKEEIREKHRKEYEENRKKIEEQEKREREEKQKKIEALLSKPWVQKLKESFEIDEVRKREIQRFKEKYHLSDDELQIVETYNKPYVKITAKIDLRPIGVDRTVYIRNYYPDEWYEFSETGRGHFSDYANNLADKLAEIFGGTVGTFTNEDEESCQYNVWLVVALEDNDNIEVASTEVDECY